MNWTIIGIYSIWYLSGFALLMLCNIYLFGKKGEILKVDIGVSMYFSIFSGHVFALLLFMIWLTNKE